MFLELINVVIIVSLLTLYINIHYKRVEKVKLMFFIGSYGLSQLNYLYTKIQSILAICESGYIIKTIIHHTDIINESYFQNFFCFSQNKSLDIVLIKRPSQVGHFLAKQHRIYIHENIKEIQKYDHVGYFENDMDFTIYNLNYYLYTWKLIQRFKLENYMVGFKRYEISECDNGDVWKSCPDGTYNIKLKIINSKPFINSFLGYSAMWILPKERLLRYIKEKEFIEIPKERNYFTMYGIREYYAYMYWEKHYQPLIPLERVENCFVHHMSNRYIHFQTAIQISEIYNQINMCRDKEGMIKYFGEIKDKDFSINYNKRELNKCIKIKNC